MATQRNTRWAVMFALACCLSQLAAAQRPAIVPGDTVRLWYVGKPDARTGVVTAFRGDSLRLGHLAVEISEIRQIDLARGRTSSRKHLGILIGAGAAAGAVTALIVSNPVNRSEGARAGLTLGAGLGYLASRRLPQTPTWYTVFPVSSALIPIADTPVPPATIEHFPDIKPGQRVRVWISPGGFVEGRFREVLRPSSLLLLCDRPDSIPLSSIDALAVGRTHAKPAAAEVGAAFGATVALTAMLGCALYGGCDAQSFVIPVAVGTAIGAALGAALGSRATVWEHRYSR